MTRQLILLFPQGDFLAEQHFIEATSNAAALAWLAQPEEWPERRLVLVGEAGSGKSHLLTVFARKRGASFLRGDTLRGVSTLPVRQPLVIDDADFVPDEEALLHLLNSAAEHRQPVLLSARSAPSHWDVALPDLASRLRATTAVALQMPDDLLLRTLFARLLAERQIAVAEDMQDWLLARLPRTGGALREAACRLDRLSLAAGRSIGKTLAARVVEDMEQDDSEER